MRPVADLRESAVSERHEVHASPDCHAAARSAAQDLFDENLILSIDGNVSSGIHGKILSDLRRSSVRNVEELHIYGNCSDAAAQTERVVSHVIFRNGVYRQISGGHDLPDIRVSCRTSDQSGRFVVEERFGTASDPGPRTARDIYCVHFDVRPDPGLHVETFGLQIR